MALYPVNVSIWKKLILTLTLFRLGLKDLSCRGLPNCKILVNSNLIKLMKLLKVKKTRAWGN